MREALHIFLKDTRQLRYPILVLLTWTVIFVLATGRPEPALFDPAWQWLIFVRNLVVRWSDLFLLGWAYLVARVFHAEALPGDRQFWLTRPYRRASLFGAKGLFVLCHITVPFTLAQAAIALLHGFPLTSVVPGLLWEQVLVLVTFILPVAVVASLTRTFVQFVGAAFCLPVILIAMNMLRPWQGFGWMRNTVGILAIVVGGTAVLMLQFRYRLTRRSRVLALVCVLATVATLPVLSWKLAFNAQKRLAGMWDGELTANLLPSTSPPPGAAKPRSQRDTRTFQLIFHVSGPKSGTQIVCEAREISIEGPNGLRWQSGLGIVSTYYAISQVPDGCPMSVQIPRAFSDAVTDTSVSIRTTLFLTVFGSEQSTNVPTGRQPTFVDKIGICRAERYDFPPSAPSDRRSFARVDCRAAFRTPPLLLVSPTQSSGSRWLFAERRLSYSPFPADLRIWPIEWSSVSLAATDVVTLTTVEPVAHVRTTVDVTGVSLKDYEL